MANTYFSPDGNPEIWEEKPEGYFTPEEWEVKNPRQKMDEEGIRVNELEMKRFGILASLSEIDMKRVRPLSAIVDGTSTEEDTARLHELNAEAASLREELASLGKENE